MKTSEVRKAIDLILYIKIGVGQFLTCPKGFGLKLAKLGLKTPLKNKVKQKQSKAEPS